MESKVHSVRLRTDISEDITEMANNRNRNFSNTVETMLVTFLDPKGPIWEHVDGDFDPKKWIEENIL
jgi:hypothetical protein